MTTERRHYYRIEDLALIKYRVVPHDTVEAERRAIMSNVIKAANLQAALMSLDVRLQDLLPAVRGESRIVAEALDLINKKLSLLGRVVALDGGSAGTLEYREHQPSKVSLSGGGIGIQASAPLALVAYLAIDLVLLPSNHPMRMIGRVVECREAAPGNFVIAIEFEGMREVDRDTLIQHVVRKQSAALREERIEDSDLEP